MNRTQKELTAAGQSGIFTPFPINCSRKPNAMQKYGFFLTWPIIYARISKKSLKPRGIGKRTGEGERGKVVKIFHQPTKV